MEKQSPEAQQAAIEQMANRALGQPQQPGPAQPQPEKDTAMDKAQTEGAPVTEGDKAQESPVTYKVKMEDGEREFTEAQLKGMLDRYGKMNQANDYMRPVLGLATEMLKRNPGMTPDQLVKGFIQMANQPLQQGGPDERPNEQKAPVQDASEISAQFEQWEKDNAASLPPGYKDMFGQTQAVQQQMQQMMQMMNQMMGQSRGMVDGAKAASQDARGQMVNATKQRIANNLNAVQQKLGLPDEKAEEFMSFAAERGYVMEDFIDPMLTLKVAQDFKNSSNAGEFGRLQDMAQRRQAFTGTAQTQPGQGGPANEGVDPNLEGMINRAMNRRM
jgi:hypothetical protein